jgi:hypothetical protein
MVPARVPSLRHSSLPWLPSSAENSSWPPPSVSSVISGRNRANRTVPTCVPSLRHSSWRAESILVKNTMPATVTDNANRACGPVLISRTTVGPGADTAVTGKIAPSATSDTTATRRRNTVATSPCVSTGGNPERPGLGHSHISTVPAKSLRRKALRDVHRRSLTKVIELVDQSVRLASPN